VSGRESACRFPRRSLILRGVSTAGSPVRSGISHRFAAVLGIGAAFVAFIAIDQCHWWALKPDYSFGWLVPLLVALIVADRWPRIRELFRSAEPSPLGLWQNRLSQVAAATTLLLGMVVFLFGAIYRAQQGPTQPGSFALAVGFPGILLGMVFLNVPASKVGCGQAPVRWETIGSDARFRAIGIFIFPALIWILSAPLMTAVENAVSLFLLRRVVGVVSAVFGLLGYPLLQQGNVLILPRGEVGVADACSGIRSLTGCLFAGSFLAAAFLDRFWKKVLLVAAAMVLAFLMNLVRSVFLTAWAYAYGSEAIEGKLHDATGFAVLGLTTLGLFALLPLFRGSTWRRWLGLAEPDIPLAA
jgi:exosortase